MPVMPGESAEWTVDDLDRLPDDGLRYELLDGTLLVSPAPSRVHQRAAFQLGVLLHRACPAGRRKDAVYKRSKYEDEGVPSYWIIDPDEPSITAYELCDGRYVTVGAATGDTALTLDRPFPVTIAPADLIR